MVMGHDGKGGFRYNRESWRNRCWDGCPTWAGVIAGAQAARKARRTIQKNRWGVNFIVVENLPSPECIDANILLDLLQK
jgi:hypothetical protein